MATKLIHLIESTNALLNESIVPLRSIEEAYDIDKAEGFWLDMLNFLIDGTVRPTGAYSDSELRKRMKVKIALNAGSGTTESVISAVRYFLLLDDISSWTSVSTEKVSLKYSGADIIIELESAIIKSRDRLREIQNFIPVGVGLYIVEFTPNNTFTVSTADGAALELSDTKGIDYGKLAEIITYSKNKGG